MAKPILLLRLPLNAREHLDKMQHSLPEDLGQEYHVLFVIDHGRINIDIEVHNVLNATDIELEELKQQILKSINEKMA